MVEFVIGLVIMSLLLLVVQHLIVSSQRGSLRGREASMQLYSETVLSQIMERDFRTLLPYAVHSTRGKVGGAISFAPTRTAATEILFSRLGKAGVEQIRYLFDPDKKEIRREVVDQTGQAVQTARFASGMVTDFVMSDRTGTATVFRMSITMTGKERTTRIERIFSHGFRHQQFSQHWVYHFP